MNYFDSNKFCARASQLFGTTGQKEISILTGISQAVISSIKTKSIKSPSADTIYSIARSYNVSTDWLLGLTDVKSTDKATKELCATLGLSENTIGCLLDSTDIYAKKSIDWLVSQHLESISSNSNLIKEIISNSNVILKEAAKEMIKDYNLLFENSILWNLYSLINLKNEFTDIQFVVNNDKIDVNLFTNEKDFFQKQVDFSDNRLKLTVGRFDYKELMCNKYAKQINEQITNLVHSIKDGQKENNDTAIINYLENAYNKIETIRNKCIEAEKNGND